MKINFTIPAPLSYGCSPDDDAACKLAINQTCYFQRYSDVRQLGWTLEMNNVEIYLMFTSCILLSIRAISIWLLKDL